MALSISILPICILVWSKMLAASWKVSSNLCVNPVLNIYVWCATCSFISNFAAPSIVCLVFVGSGGSTFQLFAFSGVHCLLDIMLNLGFDIFAKILSHLACCLQWFQFWILSDCCRPLVFPSLLY